MKIALFGGSFDPPHVGHLSVVKEALKELDIDLLVVVPTYVNPFKKGFYAPPRKKIVWLKKALKSFKKVRVCDFEIERQRATYTIETVEYLRRKFAPQKLYLIIGADNLKDLTRWKSYKKLSKRAEFVVATRNRIRIPQKFKILSVSVPISSTRLRGKVTKRYLPKPVASEIYRFYKKINAL